MTITSLDNFGHASGSISMSELRDYYGQTGASDAGNNYGAGSGGSASEVGAGSTGSGSSGAIFVTYYEVNT